MTNTNHALSIREPVVYQNYCDIHHDSTGIICISQILEGKWQNKYGRYQAMLDYMQGLESQDEIFFSQNTFKKFKRSTEHLFELKALYIDLDFHKNTNLTREQILGGINILIEDGKFPKPTHIINSGHGINLIWRIKRIPAQALPLWRTVEQYLYEQLKDLGADSKALDATRVFRVEGTYNSKYAKKNQVTIIHSSPIEYDLHLIKEYVQFTPRKTKRQSSQRRTIVRLFNRFSLYYNRYQDILAICKLRQYEMTGHREITLFLYRYYGCAYLSDNELALQNALELNSRFTEPLSEKEVIRATSSAERAAAKLKYGYQNKTLIRLLDITDEEMAMTDNQGEYLLKSIISTEEKYRRNNLRRYNNRRNEKGKTQTEQRMDKNMERILQMKAQGKKQKEIAQELGMTIRNVQKYYKLIREQEETCVKTNEIL